MSAEGPQSAVGDGTSGKVTDQATRKARLWELFQELFGQLQTEAQDDFDDLFGRAFLKAYEEQLARLRRERDPR